MIRRVFSHARKADQEKPMGKVARPAARLPDERAPVTRSHGFQSEHSQNARDTRKRWKPLSIVDTRKLLPVKNPWADLIRKPVREKLRLEQCPKPTQQHNTEENPGTGRSPWLPPSVYQFAVDISRESPGRKRGRLRPPTSLGTACIPKKKGPTCWTSHTGCGRGHCFFVAVSGVVCQEARQLIN